MMGRVKKYDIGPQISNLDHLKHALDTDGYVMMDGRPTHAGFVLSMHFRVVDLGIIRGGFHRAKIRSEWLQQHGDDQ